MTLQERFREARKARGLSLARAGEELGVKFQTVWRWEQDGSDLTDRTRSHLELWIAENRHEGKR